MTVYSSRKMTMTVTITVAIHTIESLQVKEEEGSLRITDKTKTSVKSRAVDALSVSEL